jgi:hypothetical protein
MTISIIFLAHTLVPKLHRAISAKRAQNKIFIFIPPGLTLADDA